MEHTQVAAWILLAMNHLVEQRDNRELATALATRLAEAHEAMPAETMLHVAAVEVAVFFREGSLDPRAIGDHGESWCVGQINLPGATRTAEGWNGPDLIEPIDGVGRCVAVADRMMTESMRACAKLPIEERLAAYARGVCSSLEGRRISRDRMWLARSLLAEVPVPDMPDNDHDGEVEAYDVEVDVEEDALALVEE